MDLRGLPFLIFGALQACALQRLGLRVQDLGFRGLGLGFRVWGLGFRVWGLGFRGINLTSDSQTAKPS